MDKIICDKLGWGGDVGYRYFDVNKGHLNALDENDKQLLKREYDALKNFAKELKEFVAKTNIQIKEVSYNRLVD